MTALKAACEDIIEAAERTGTAARRARRGDAELAALLITGIAMTVRDRVADVETLRKMVIAVTRDAKVSG